MKTDNYDETNYAHRMLADNFIEPLQNFGINNHLVEFLALEIADKLIGKLKADGKGIPRYSCYYREYLEEVLAESFLKGKIERIEGGDWVEAKESEVK